MADVIVTSNDSYIIDIDNDGNASDKIFKVSHDNGTELFRIQENGNFGIGATSPGAGKVQIGDGNTDISPALYIFDKSADSSHPSETVLRNACDGANIALLLYATNNGSVLKGGGGLFLDPDIPALCLAYGDDTTPQVCITDGGNVGIGTSSPAQKLQIEGNCYLHGDVGIRISSPAATLHINQGYNYPALILDYVGATGSRTQLQFANNGTNKWSIENETSDNSLTIYSASTTTLTIAQDGKMSVGGVASPSIDGKLHVVSGYITLEEISEPGNAPTDSVRLF